MSSLIQLLIDFTCNERIPCYLDHVEYDSSEALADRNLNALKQELSAGQLELLEKYQDAQEELRGLELEAMFRAAFSVARELG